MFNLLSKRLLGVLQLTRMGLVFTALSDSFCTLIIFASSVHGDPNDPDRILTPTRYLAIAAMSIGLYGFGMSLNDIIDRRRDRQIAAHRPLPSGRIGVVTAHVTCGLLMLLSLAGAAVYSRAGGFLSSFIADIDGQFSGNATAVPEPGVIGVLAISGVAVLRRRRA